jgi:hypothetical protein
MMTEFQAKQSIGAVVRWRASAWHYGKIQEVKRSSNGHRVAVIQDFNGETVTKRLTNLMLEPTILPLNQA